MADSKLFSPRPRRERCPVCQRPQESAGTCLLCGPDLATAELCADDVVLLLYLETCLVDRWGVCEAVRLNDIDLDTAKGWTKVGLIEFRRIPFHDLAAHNNGLGPGDGSLGPLTPYNTHTVRFSARAWTIAHRLRRDRAERHVETVG